MFYIKTRRGTRIPIEDGDDGNVFTQCPVCGKEFPVFLSDCIVDGCLDANFTAWYCSACNDKANLLAGRE